MENNLLKDLNQAQKNAVEYCQGPQLVVAGAGSGKTRVLTYKIAYLISKGIKPYRIMALTFTNKASNEMKERIDKLLGYEASRNLWMGTFHSIFGKILRLEADKIGFDRNYTIFDATDSLNLIKSIIKELNINDEIYKPKSVAARISSAKNELWTADGYAQNNDFLILDAKENREHFHHIYSKYAQRCKSSNVMDFDDLLLYTNILFKANPDVLNVYRQRFDYILVDEYQDTNYSQYLIIKKLSKMHRKLCVVGDDAQSIYSFRGAKIQNILNFKNDYPDYKLYKLEQNYRSTQNIVNAANSLIQKNKNQIEKKLFSKNNQGSKIKIEKTYTDGLEGMGVAENISRLLLDNHYTASDCAILYRTNAQSRIMEDALRKFNIPYKVFGSLSFFQRKEIKDVVAYIRFTVNQKDSEAFRRIVNYPSRKIGTTSVNKIFQFSENSNIPIWEILKYPHKYNVGLNAGIQSKLRGFANLIESFIENINNYNASEFLVDLVNKSGIQHELFNDKTPEGVNRYENLQELFNAVQNFCDQRKALVQEHSIIDYLENIALLTDLENEEENENKDKVSLMTIHFAKGLEFKNVFVVGVEENLFPNAMSIASAKELEEERRLFYVAMTRAMENLFVFYSISRFRFGSLQSMRPSRFIREINEDFVDCSAEEDTQQLNYNNEKRNINFVSESKTQYKNLDKKTVEKPSKVPNTKFVSLDKANMKNANFINISEYKIGMQVAHNSFGKGEVLEIIEDGNNSKIIVNFDTGGEKTLLLKFAKLLIL
ncbi:MAG: UvrD-helicase domain-containing protein [Bacteroidales bacterium]|nr:UvrD-helicase domain-containing protein [Bacteroidales bacterium]MCK9499099.1 UvrD-helicase domain-containing protein [Bacteroidales bacterium]MDY0314344.1 UvrD-helicase domain-containing protein [Bacteroidales bacterium]NLB86904.1 UvrD-helicase domain-containing protein [Bacteroidales bacterium]